MSKVHKTRVGVLAALAGASMLAASVPAGANQPTQDGSESHARATQFIVKYADNTPERQSMVVREQSLDRASDELSGIAELGFVRPMSFGADVVTADRPLDEAETAAVLSELNADPNVEYVEVDAVFQGALTPNDPRYPEQWHYQDTPVGIELPEAWDLATGAGVTVAVVDFGSIDHIDLSANYVGGYDFITDPAFTCDSNGRDSDPTDSCNIQHGNHVAGTIAAVTDNGVGVAGVAFDAQVVPVRVLGSLGGSLSDLVDGINWAAGGAVPGVPVNPNPASVVNISIEGYLPCPQSLQEAMDAVIGNGALPVVAAGNMNTNVTLSAPANCAGDFLRVAASGRSGAKAWYSNFGALIDVTAPGGSITAPGGNLPVVPENGVLSTIDGDNYQFREGTSMAAPHVAGVAALITEVAPDLTPAQVARIIKRTAKPLPGPCGGGCGDGLLDAHAAVKEALRPSGTGSLGSSS